MKKSLYFVSFAVGALLGSAASYFVLKKKFEKIAQEEIDSVKEAFNKKNEVVEPVEPNEVVKEITDDKEVDLKEYNSILESNGYGGDVVVSSEPSYVKVISPVELGDIEHYRIIGLTYFADGILADDKGNIVSVEDTIGSYALTQFGEYDDDAVHVRNSKKEVDYEVLLDERDYSEVYK